MPMCASPEKIRLRISAEFSPIPAVMTTASVRVITAKNDPIAFWIL